MCGIVGKYYFNLNRYDAGDLPRMMKAIAHRGPDSSGTFSDSRVALGVQRLSIIDIDTGDQPLYNETGQITLMANGEIYNYRALRAMLESSGHRFKTRSDCEVIVHLYEEYGNDFIDRLNGMFAFCLYDNQRQRLLLARDRIGIKPLYYRQTPDMILFASEIKAILAARGVSAIPEENVLDEYFCFGSLCNGRTFYSGIRSLDPGSSMEIAPTGIHAQRYWRPKIAESRLSESQYLGKIESAMHDSVARQMMSDVPLGSLLSGGVDSSWVSAIAGTLAPGLKTFTVGFPEPAYNEIPYARLVARSSRLDYHDMIIDNQEYSDALAETIRHHDEPLMFPSAVQNRLVCRYAREFVKVVLTGEGADELFGGYPRQYAGKLQKQLPSLGDANRKMIGLVLQYLPGRKTKLLRQALTLSPHDLVLWNAFFCQREKLLWLFDKPDVDISNRIELLNKVWQNDLDTIDNLLLFDQQTYLQSILAMKDKMSMAESLELRVPMLDNEMIATAEAIPGNLKIRRLRTKYLFKKAAVKQIPRQIVYKRKMGFGVPVHQWLRDKAGLGRYLDQLMDSAGQIDRVNRTKLGKAVAEHRGGLRNHTDLLWPMINCVLWREQCIDNRAS